jgi:thiamine biosynthesis lipoprotein
MNEPEAQNEPTPMTIVRLALNAMATRFELVLHGENATRLRGAGEAALKEVERLEAQLSLYRPTSEIARVNASAAREEVRVSPSVFALLQHARQLHTESGGAFDITIAPLVRCWGFMHGTGRLPSAAEIEEVRARSGMAHVLLDEKNYSVRFDKEGVMIDLGAIGKGYAVDCAAEFLRETGVTCALLHGGTSTVYGLGAPPDAEGWNIALASAPDRATGTTTVMLRDQALSVSAVWGKSFEADGKTFGHVLDPRTGWPVNHAVQAAVALPSATETDALSTALLVVGLAGHDAISRLRPDMRTMVVAPAEQGFRVKSMGILPQNVSSPESPLSCA